MHRCARQRRHTRRERHLEDTIYASHDMTTTCRAPFAARMRSRRRSKGVSPAKHSGKWGESAGAGSRCRVPGKTAPREAACAPVPPAHWFGTLRGRVKGTRTFARALWVAWCRATASHGTIGRAKTTKLKMRGPRLVKVVSGHLEWPSFGQNSFLSSDWSLSASQ